MPLKTKDTTKTNIFITTDATAINTTLHTCRIVYLRGKRGKYMDQLMCKDIVASRCLS